jgi:hypothetical protein
MSPDALERGPDPYGYLFRDFCECSLTSPVLKG